MISSRSAIGTGRLAPRLCCCVMKPLATIACIKTCTARWCSAAGHRAALVPRTRLSRRRISSARGPSPRPSPRLVAAAEPGQRDYLCFGPPPSARPAWLLPCPDAPWCEPATRRGAVHPGADFSRRPLSLRAKEPGDGTRQRPGELAGAGRSRSGRHAADCAGRTTAGGNPPQEHPRAPDRNLRHQPPGDRILPDWWGNVVGRSGVAANPRDAAVGRAGGGRLGLDRLRLAGAPGSRLHPQPRTSPLHVISPSTLAPAPYIRLKAVEGASVKTLSTAHNQWLSAGAIGSEPIIWSVLYTEYPRFGIKSDGVYQEA